MKKHILVTAVLFSTTVSGNCVVLMDNLQPSQNETKKTRIRTIMASKSVSHDQFWVDPLFAWVHL